MDIWRMPQRMLGLSIVIFLIAAPIDADIIARNCDHSVLSLSHALQGDAPNMGLRHGIFASTIDTGRSAAAVLLPEPYSYVLASVGIASLLAMGSIFRKRKDPESSNRDSRRTGHRGQSFSSR